MKTIKPYNTFVNESVRDMMKPKSEEDILNYVMGLSKEELNLFLVKSVLNQEILFIKIALQVGADPNTIDPKTKLCVLYRAVVGGITSQPNKEVIKMLLDAGADPTLKSKAGLVPLNNARSWKKWDIYDLLQKYVKTNESVRDMLKPKSMDDIKRDIKEKKIKPDEQLLQAASGGSLELVKGAFKRGAKKDEYALVNASINGHTDIIEYLIDELGYDVHYMGEVPLRYAIASGRLDAVRVLLDRGADIHYHNENPLNTAISHSYDDIALYLVSRGADVDKLRRSLESGGFEISKEETDNFIENHMNESVRDSMKPKPESEIRKELEKLPARKLMHTAVMNGVDIRDIFSKEEIAGMNRRMKKEYQEDIKELRTKIIELNDSYYKGDVKESMDDDNKGYEIELNFPGCMKVFARKDLDNIYFEAGYELEPIGETTRVISDWEEPETLKSCVACIKSWLNVHWHWTPKDKSNESVRDMMKPKTDEDIKDKLYHMSNDDLYELLSNTLWHGDEDSLQLYLNNGTDIDVKNNQSETILMRFVKTNSLPVVDMLLKFGADPNIGNDNGTTPLIIAAINGVGVFVERILNNTKFNPMKHDQLNRALRFAKDKHNNVEEILTLYKNRTMNESVRDMMKPRPKEDIRKKVNDLESETSVYTKFLSAAKYGLVDILEDMIGDERITTLLKNDALWMSAKRGETETVKFLLDNGADINTGGNMSLVNAVINNHYDTVKLLLDRGADVNAKNSEAFDIAYRNGTNEIYNLLKKYMKDR